MSTVNFGPFGVVRQLSIRPHWVARWQVSPGWKFPRPIRRPVIATWYVQKGVLGAQVGDRDYLFGPGTLAIIPSDIASAVWSARQEELVYLSLGCELSFGNEEVTLVSKEGDEEQPRVVVITRGLPERFLELWSTMFEVGQQFELHPSQVTASQFLGMVYEWWGIVIEASQMSLQPKNRRLDPRVAEALALVRDNLNAGPTLSWVASALHLSPSRLRQLFTNSAGMSFRQSVQETRIREAKRLLLSTDLSVLEIGEKVGYSDPRHFSRAFKRLEHVSPSEYRRIARRPF